MSLLLNPGGCDRFNQEKMKKRTIIFQYNKLLICLYDNENSMRKYYRVSPKLLPFCNSQKMDRESLKKEKPQKEIYRYQLLLF